MESCLRMKVQVPQCSHWSEFHPVLPVRSPYKPPEKSDHPPEGRLSPPLSCRGGEVYSLGCPLTGPMDWWAQGMDWPYTVNLLTLNSVSSSYIGCQKMKDFLILPVCLAPAKRHNYHICPIYCPQRPSALTFTVPHEWWDDSCVAGLATHLGISSSPPLSCYPHQSRMFLSWSWVCSQTLEACAKIVSWSPKSICHFRD